MNRTIPIIIAVSFISFGLQAQTASWYKCWIGTIDKYEITMHLHKTGHTYAGYYFYNSREEPIYFIGDDTTNKDKINLLAFVKSANPGNENFSFEYGDSNFTGEWKKNDNSKALSFSAVESIDTSLIPFTFIYTYGESKLKPLWKESPTATFEAASVWPKNNTSKSLFVKNIISNELTKKMLLKTQLIFF
jgi:hypothetical protein